MRMVKDSFTARGEVLLITFVTGKLVTGSLFYHFTVYQITRYLMDMILTA